VRKSHLLITVLAVVVAACAPETGGSTSTTEGGQVTTTPAPTDDGSGDTPSSTEGPEVTTTMSPGATETTSGRPVAPDFTLELGDGGNYTLSEGGKPVYLIFWAEW
jgi:hypothetical protein